MPRTMISDDAECTVWENTSPGWPDAKGSTRNIEVVPKAGSTAANGESLRTQLAAQIAPGSPARNALATNTTYIALASPSAGQTTAEVKALAQQNNVIIPTLIRTIRVLLGALDADT